MENKNINVEMCGDVVTRTYTQTIMNFLYFQRELKISPKSNTCWNKEGFSVKFDVDTVSVLIGIGKDHSADLIMTKDSWDAFVNGAEISIDTVNEFERKYIRKRRKSKEV